MKNILIFYSIFYLSIPFTCAQSWDTVGQKISDFGNYGPNVIYADSTCLYMAGAFKTIGNKHIQGIGRWNGIQWDSLSWGIDGLEYDSLPSEYPEPTNAITKYNGKLYVGGWFGSLGHIKSPCVGTWDGSQWDSLPVQPFKSHYSATVWALRVINNKLYMGGGFDTVAGFSCVGIACWNDTNWSSLNFPNLGSFGAISAICEYKGSIYVGGNFYGNNPNDRRNILRHDSTGNWDSVGGGIKGDSWVNSMVVYDSELYVAGYFYKSDGNAGDCIQRWDGTQWHDVGGGVEGGDQIFKLIVYNGKLFAMGGFDTAGGVPADNIAEWNDTEWCSLGNTFNNTILTGCIYKDSLYIGGGFTKINEDSIIYIAEWTGGDYTDSCGVNTTSVPQINPAISGYELRIEPNPSNGKFAVDFRAEKESGETSIEIYNMMGQQVYDEMLKPVQHDYKIDLSSHPAGIYLYRVVTTDGKLLGDGKFVIEK